EQRTAFWECIDCRLVGGPEVADLVTVDILTAEGHGAGHVYGRLARRGREAGSALGAEPRVRGILVTALGAERHRLGPSRRESPRGSTSCGAESRMAGRSLDRNLRLMVSGNLGPPVAAGQPSGPGQPEICAWYSAADSSVAVSSGSAGVISINHPSPYGSGVRSSGASAERSLRAATVPVTGAYRSLTLLVDANSPHGPPATTPSPTSGGWTQTTPPSGACA